MAGAVVHLPVTAVQVVSSEKGLISEGKRRREGERDRESVCIGVT